MLSFTVTRTILNLRRPEEPNAGRGGEEYGFTLTNDILVEWTYALRTRDGIA